MVTASNCMENRRQGSDPQYLSSVKDTDTEEESR